MKHLLTPKDLEAELPDLGRSTIYALLKTGVIPSVRLGKKIFTPRAAFDNWLKGVGLGSLSLQALERKPVVPENHPPVQ
jgi:excisionase family DNA binding protein